MLEAVTRTLRDRRSQGWFVGGTVRDRQAGRPSPDLDLVVADDPAAVARQLANRLSSPWFALSARHGAYRVMGDQGHVDVAGMRGTGILDDLALRDFTVNAMAVSVDGGGLVDPFGGRTHLLEKRLVAVSDGIFTDDPLRLMRAARFRHVLDLQLDPRLETLLRTQVSNLARVAPERVAAEMALILATGPSAEVVRLWDGLGLLQHLLPEVTTSWEDGREAGELQSALEWLDRALSSGPSWFPDSAVAFVERLAVPVDGAWTRRAALPLALSTQCLPSERAAAVARRLRMSGVMLSLLRTAGASPEEGCRSLEALDEAARSPRAAVLFLWDSAPWEPETILLAACRAAGPSAGAGSGALPASEILGPGRKLMTLWAGRAACPPSPLPVDGQVLMKELGLTPGPRLGQILREARLAWEAAEVTAADQVMSLAETLARETMEPSAG
jgi:hypothetical protein